MFGLKSIVGLAILVLPPAASAGPIAKISVPGSIPAWQHAKVLVTVRNTTRQPILPVHLRLESAAGLLESWGHRGRSPGWTSVALARRSGRSFAVLFTPPMPQQVKGPVRWPKTDTRVLRMRPVMPGETQNIPFRLQAAYSHGGRLAATLVYLVLDPNKRFVCAVSGPATLPRKAVFRPCRRVRRIAAAHKGRVYVRETEVARNARKVVARSRFRVIRPAFDLPAARVRARVRSGPVAYDRKRRQWILVDLKRNRTFAVPARGRILSLPGDWREKLLILSDWKETHVYWSGRTVSEAKRLLRDLKRKGFNARYFSFKGRKSRTRLTILINRNQVAALGRLMSRWKARMKGYGVVWGR